MKKTYRKPGINAFQLATAQLFAGSMKIEVNDDQSIDNPANMWSNQESSHDLWGNQGKIW